MHKLVLCPQTITCPNALLKPANLKTLNPPTLTESGKARSHAQNPNKQEPSSGPFSSSPEASPSSAREPNHHEEAQQRQCLLRCPDRGPEGPSPPICGSVLGPQWVLQDPQEVSVRSASRGIWIRFCLFAGKVEELVLFNVFYICLIFHFNACYMHNAYLFLCLVNVSMPMCVFTAICICKGFSWMKTESFCYLVKCI